MNKHSRLSSRLFTDMPKQLALLCAVACMAAAAQTSPSAPTTTPAGVDESKIPDWIKKQADNPVKWIIQQDNKTKAKATATAADDKAVAKKAATKKPARPDEEAVVATPSTPNTAITPTNTRAIAPAASAATPTTNSAAAAAPSTINKPGEQPAAAAPELVAPAVVPPPTVVALAPSPEPKAPPPALLEELVPINQPQPQLTREVLQAGVRNGRVMVSFTVNTDGSVKDTAIVESSDRLLNRSVLAAVKQWIYKPISQPQAKTVEIAFQLE